MCQALRAEQEPRVEMVAAVAVAAVAAAGRKTDRMMWAEPAAAAAEPVAVEQPVVAEQEGAARSQFFF